MANIQKENGFVSIATEFYEALLKISLSDYQRRVFEAIIRKTWGWNKKKDIISLSQIISLTGIDQSNVCKALKFLKGLNMINRDSDGMTQVQKDYEKWGGVANQPVANQPVAENASTSGEPATATSGEPATYKRQVKDTIQKTIREGSKKASFEADEIFPEGEWTDHDFYSQLSRWDGRRVQTAHPYDVAVYYFLKFHEKHRSLTDLEHHASRRKLWEREKKTWLNVSKLDPLDDFVTTAICDMSHKGQVIDSPISFFHWAKKAYQGQEL